LLSSALGRILRLLCFFHILGLSAKVLAAIKTAGYKAPTPIQDQAIPHVLARRDVLGIAQTGTGKTLPSCCDADHSWNRVGSARHATHAHSRADA
jgi:hypothetical protein